MTIKKLFEETTDFKDIQALIMFLTFEKQILNMDDSIDELDLYFKEKHTIRMNKELAAYKKKMNMEYEPYIYELRNGRKLLYIYAYNEKQATYIAARNLFYAEEVTTCDMADLMNYNGRDMTFQTITSGIEAPKILGGFQMYNNITLVGRWTKDTEIRMSNNGTEILNGSLAVSDPFQKEHTDFIDVTAFKQLALNTNQYTGKGSKVLVGGKLQQQRWEKDGQKRSKHVVIANQIVFLDDKPNKKDNSLADAGEQIDISDDSLPF